MRRTAAFTATAVAALAPAGVAAAGIIERRPVVEEGVLTYRDDFDFADGFKATESDDGRELVFERTTGEQPLRSLEPACAAESEDLVRCRDLAETKVLLFRLIAGDDVADASAVRSFRVEAATGSGDAELTGGALGDDLRSDNGDDVLRGGPGDDTLSAGNVNPAQTSDRDTVDGGPGRDTLATGSEDDVILARDGERDAVDCGQGTGDVAVADAADAVRGCEVVELPPRSEPPAPDSPQGAPPQPPAGPAPAAAPPAAAPRAASLRRVVRIPAGRCVPRRGLRVRVAPVAGFVPARTRLRVDGRTAAVRRGRRVVLRVRPAAGRRRLAVRITVTGRDGRRVTVARRLATCRA